MPLPPAMVFPIATTTADRTPYVGACCLRGWSFRETTGAAVASLVIYDGAATAGQIVTAIDLSANESTRDYVPGNGILLRTSCLIDVTAGSIQGSVLITPITHADDLEWVFGESGPHLFHPGA